MRRGLSPAYLIACIDGFADEIEKQYSQQIKHRNGLPCSEVRTADHPLVENVPYIGKAEGKAVPELGQPADLFRNIHPHEKKTYRRCQGGRGLRSSSENTMTRTANKSAVTSRQP